MLAEEDDESRKDDWDVVPLALVIIELLVLKRVLDVEGHHLPNERLLALTAVHHLSSYK